MFDFLQLQEIMRDRLERDRAVQSIEVTGATLETTLADAAALLEVPLRKIEYEIVERGSTGFLGMGKKEWRIQAYERIDVTKSKLGESLLEEDAGETGPVIEDRDGAVYLHFNSSGEALLKVTTPSGNGRKAAEAYAVQLLKDRKVLDIDMPRVKGLLRDANGEYVKVGVFEHHSYNDSIVRTEIPEGDMRAYMVVTAPGEGGCDISFETFITVLKNTRIVYGIKEDFIQNFVDQPISGQKVEVAVGKEPVHGKDAYIQYNFETDQNKVKLKEKSDGKIDFKELNIIQNVVENQPVAKKIVAEIGIHGETVSGKTIPARNGRDINIPLGTNVHLANDGETVLADMNGQVVIVSGLINVEPVYTVNGDVNLKTGNIIFLGTVIIKGQIEDGFSVKAAGNIEVSGTVAKAELDAEGDIIIHQGINGKGGGHIHAGKSIWARFIENANIQAGNQVVVSDGIINSQVDAYSRIICRGKRAAIMGGRLCASEEINAKVFGNPTTGTETVCEVGFDPKSKEELGKLQETKEGLEKELEDVDRNMQTLINIKKQRKNLPEDKEQFLQDTVKDRDRLTTELFNTGEEIKKVQAFLANLKTRGRVSASNKVYPGVKIIIRDIEHNVHTEYKAVTFVLEDGLVKATKYEELDEAAKKGLDGYTAN
jgi:uncharacterized protein (DUF342 family)